MVLRNDNTTEDGSRHDESAAEPTVDAPPSDEPEVINRYRSSGVSAVLLALFAIIAVAIVVLAQNSASTPFEFLWFEAAPPLFVLLLATGLLSSVATVLVAYVWRRRRQRVRTEREELARLRKKVDET